MQEKVNFKDNSAYYLKIASPYKITFLIIISILAFQALIEVGHSFILKMIIDSATEFTSGIITQEQIVSLVMILAVIYFISVLALAVLKYYRLIFLNDLEIKLMFDVKRDIFDHLLSLSHSFHTTHRTGSLISKLLRSSKSIESLTDFITYHGSPLVLKLIISFIVIAYFDILSAIIVLLVALTFTIYSVIILGRQQKANLERNNIEDIEKGFISDVFMNIETIKHFGKEKRISSLFTNVAKDTYYAYKRFWDFYATTEAGFALILGVGTIFLMYFTLSRFIAGEMTVGSIAFIYASYTALVLPLFEFMWGVRRTYEAMSDMQAIVDYKKIQNEVPDEKNASPIKITKGTVEFENINFNYGRKDVLKNFSLKINPKEKIALVGKSGAGKTTIVKLLYRLYDPKTGVVKIDGKNVKKVTQESLRSELSIVPQECILFNDTIYNNVIFSKPSATKKEVICALKVAQLYDFVKSLPEQENTIVGERGIKLSGGEKQRLSIARAVLANKKILVLDEATSSLDSTTEHQIQIALAKLMQGKTTIMIAHRLSTIMNADRIIVVENGEIKQIGTHEELTTKSGIYQKLWKLQKEGTLIK